MEEFTHAFVRMQTVAVLEVVKFIEEAMDKRDASIRKAIEDRDLRIEMLEARIRALESSDVGTPPVHKTAFDSPVSIKAPATTSRKGDFPAWKKCKRERDMLYDSDDEAFPRGRSLSPRTELMEAKRIVQETEPVNFENTDLNTQDFYDLISRPSIENKI